MPAKSPHILLASANPRQMLSNLTGIIDTSALDRLEAELRINAAGLFHLGENHLEFAKQTGVRYWRQRISRYYYAAYNARRAIMLEHAGIYTTDSSDHQKVNLPSNFHNRETYVRRFSDLRSDRNLADYDHLAVEDDLLLGQSATEDFVSEFCDAAKMFLLSRGVRL
jgi:hypothetical protein